MRNPTKSKAWAVVLVAAGIAVSCSSEDDGPPPGSGNLPPALADAGSGVVAPAPSLGGTTATVDPSVMPTFGGTASFGGAGAAGGAAGTAPVPPTGAAGGGSTGGRFGGLFGGAGATTAGGFTAGGIIGGRTAGGAGLGGIIGGAGGGTAGSEPVAVPDGSTCLKGTAAANFMANGPYRVKKKDVTIGSNGAYTIFYPDPLEASCPHPIVAWGNGTAVTGSGTYAFYNEHAASYGIVVIASHNDNVGSGAFHKAGIDYMLMQNTTQGSEFFGKLSMKVGTAGHSQGGGGANAGASHPNVEAIGNVQGAFGAAPRGAAFLCLTGTEDIAVTGCKTSVNGATSPALYANWQGGTHTGTATVAGFISGDAGTKQYMRLYTAWFRCFLASDSTACALFKGGTACPVCKDMGWAEIFTKNI